jgi:hypothetical protein
MGALDSYGRRKGFYQVVWGVDYINSVVQWVARKKLIPKT